MLHHLLRTGVAHSKRCICYIARDGMIREPITVSLSLLDSVKNVSQ